LYSQYNIEKKVYKVNSLHDGKKGIDYSDSEAKSWEGTGHGILIRIDRIVN
jgi:hypothetical protein